MSEHTYAHRLSYIASKIFLDSPAAPKASAMHVVATAHSESDVRRIIETYRRQTFDGVSYLRIVSTTAAHDGAEFFESAEALAVDLKAKAGSGDFVCLWSPDDYYGPNYLTDLALARKYGEADAIGKKSFYKLFEGEAVLQNPASSYQFVDKLCVRSAVVQIDKITTGVIASWLSEPSVAFTEGLSCLSIDELNYCQHAGGFTELATVDDIQLPSTGATMNAIQLTAEAMLPCAPRVQCVGRQFDAPSLFAAISGQIGGKASAELTVETLRLDSKFPVGQRRYLWTNERFEREDLGLSDSSEIFVEGNFGSVAQFACEYYDDGGQKISHSILRAPGSHMLVIPDGCRSIRFGIRLEGMGKATIKRIAFGQTVRAPNILIARSRVLVLTKQYPSYNDLYRYGFLHSRVRSYREAGISVDVCKLRNLQENGFDEFEDVDVATVDDLAMQATLNSGQYTHVLVHALDRRTWDLLKPHLEKVKIVVWLHGAEVQLWQRREYEFERMEQTEIQRQKRLSDQRLALWKEVFDHAGEGLKFAFVSQYLRDEIEGDFDVRVPDIAAAIIHNHIDSKQFPYVTKPVEQRTRVLSIRPYTSRTYANDLTVQAILDLSKRDFFKELHFTIIGDGPLFDELTLPLRSLENVDLQRRFLRHAEIAQLHRDHGILLSPTRMDSQGVTRDEAMSSGLVPVTTAVAAIPEFVDDDCGMVVAAEDAAAMADAVEKLYREPMLFQRLSAAAAQRVRSQSGIVQTIEREIALFNQ